MLRPTLTILFACTFALVAGIGCSSGTSGATANATTGSCPAPAPADQLVLTKKDGNCDKDAYIRALTVADDVCIVTQAPPGSCSATFKCTSNGGDATTDFAGNVTLTGTGAATGMGTVTITNADGSSKCKGNYGVEISK